MNIAMNLYRNHFHGKQINIGIDELKEAILIRDDFKSVIKPNGDEEVTFNDRSCLIFTHDDTVQVSLF